MSPLQHFDFRNIPAELVSAIVEHLETDKQTLLSLGLTSHTFLSASRPFLFARVVLSDSNLHFFLKTLESPSWNTFLAIIRELVLGPGHASYSPSFFIASCWERSRILKRISSLKTLRIASPSWWSTSPLCFRDLLLSLELIHLDICILGSPFTSWLELPEVIGLFNFKALSLCSLDTADWTHPVPGPPTSVEITNEWPFYLHYLKAFHSYEIAYILSRLPRISPGHGSLPPICYLSVKLPESSSSSYGTAVADLLRATPVTHILFNVPLLIYSDYQFDVEDFSSIESIHIVDPYSAGGSLTRRRAISRLLRNLSSLTVHEITVTVSIAPLNVVFRYDTDWDEPFQEVSDTAFPRLKRFIYRVRIPFYTQLSAVEKENLIRKGPFATFLDRGILEFHEIVSPPPPSRMY